MIDDSMTLADKRPFLETRAKIIGAIRSFFVSEGFLEINPPIIQSYPSQEPYLEPMTVNLHDQKGKYYPGFLAMSPEFRMKELLTAGYKKIFAITPTFRNHESFGGVHEPEFTMLEWYRTGKDYRALMTDCEKIFTIIARTLAGAGSDPAPGKLDLTRPWLRLSVRALFKKYAQADITHLGAKRERWLALAKKFGYHISNRTTLDDIFFQIFLNRIEPHLPKNRPTFVYDYPIFQAALARRKKDDPRFAERVELYCGGLELANGFSELNNAPEQLKRFRLEQKIRKSLKRPVYPIDPHFIAALKKMPPACGMALGLDRLIMLFTGAKNIADVIAFPTSKIFSRV